MGHNILKDHAFVFCQMFMGSRMADDLSTLGELPHGQLRIDILAGTCEHSQAGRIKTHITCEIQAWFLERLKKHKIPLTDITSASLTVTMKNTIESPHKMGIPYDWTCDAIITTADREYSAHLSEPHKRMRMF